MSQHSTEEDRTATEIDADLFDLLKNAIERGNLQLFKEQFPSNRAEQILKWKGHGRFTLLHIAVDNKRPEIVDFLLKSTCIYPNPTLNQQCDFILAPGHHAKFTALDIACYRGSFECIKLLMKADPLVSAKSHGNALHLAAKSTEPRVLETFLESFGEIIKEKQGINLPDNLGLTPLMLCVVYARNAEGVKLLLQHEADVTTRVPEKKISAGQNVLHILIKKSREDPEHMNNYLDIFRAITKYLGNDPGKMSTLTTTNGECSFKPRFRRQQMNPVQFASSIGAIQFLEEIVKSLLAVNQSDNESETSREGSNTESKCKCTNIVMNYFLPLKHHARCEIKDSQPKLEQAGKTALALASMYCTFDEKVKIGSMEPITTSLLKFNRIRWVIFLAALVIHVIHMSLFTHMYTQVTSQKSAWEFLIWPLTLCVYSIICLIKWSLEFYWRFKHGRASLLYFWRRNKLWIFWKRSEFWMVNIMHTLSTIGFVVSTFVWYGQTDVMSTSVAMVLGWIQTLQYVHLRDKLRLFVVIIQMIFKDVLYILMIYSPILVGFASAIKVHIFSGLSSCNVTTSSSDGSISLGDAVFFLHTTMFGNGKLFDKVSEKVPENCTASARVILLAVYLCLSVIILLNMLIAMMNNRYERVNGMQEQLWVVETVDSIAWLPNCITGKFSAAKLKYEKGEFEAKEKDRSITMPIATVHLTIIAEDKRSF